MASAPPSFKTESTTPGRVRSVGFPRSGQSAPNENGKEIRQPANLSPHGSRPAPRKRAKGRLFIALVLFSVLSSLCYMLWNELVRYAAYGSIEGRVLPVAAAWSGIIEEVFVEDGQRVERGQLLARINSADLKIRLAKLEDDIRLAQAALATRESELASRHRELAIERLRSQSEYDQILSDLHTERAKLADLKVQNQAISQLEYRGVVSSVEAAQNSSAFEGQQKRVLALEQAAERYQTGLQALGTQDSHPNGDLADKVRLESLNEERQRLIQYQLLGEIRAPVTGRVNSVAHWSGEFVELAETLFEILEDGSLRAVLYVPQASADRYIPRQLLRLKLPPNSGSSEFEVERIDDETSYAPANLSRYFRKDERLVRVLTKPSSTELRSTQQGKSIWLGAEVRLPHGWWNKGSRASASDSIVNSSDSM